MVPALLGVFNIYYNGKHFIKSYKDHGYITGQSVTFCGKEVFDMEHGAIEHMKWDSHDHDMISLFCDGNFTPFVGSHNPILVGPCSVRIRCLYGKSVLSYSLDYAMQFFEKYREEAKFFKLGLTEAHEGTNEVIKYSDSELLEFFMRFEKEGFLDNTAVIFHSDHGVAMVGPYSVLGLEDFDYEGVLPSLFMILPVNSRSYDAIRMNMIDNENSLITPFNLYNTFQAFLNDKDNVKYSMEDRFDIIKDNIPKDSDCESSFHSEDYYDGSIEYICRCKKG